MRFRLENRLPIFFNVFLMKNQLLVFYNLCIITWYDLMVLCVLRMLQIMLSIF